MRTALEIVGLADRMDHYPRQLSGGQEQRVAIARAIVNDPVLLVADEPTGDLDAKSAREILDLLGRLNGEFGKTIVMVTHDPHAAERAKKLVHLEKGVLVRRGRKRMKYLPYILRNVRRNKLRSLLTIMAIGICLMLMTFLYGYLASMEAWGREADKYNRVVVMSSQGFDGMVPFKMLDEVRAHGRRGGGRAVLLVRRQVRRRHRVLRPVRHRPGPGLQRLERVQDPAGAAGGVQEGPAGLRRRSRAGQAAGLEDRRPRPAARARSIRSTSI